LEHDGIFPLLSQRDINPLFHIILNLNWAIDSIANKP
jgi:hypothetical protein